MRDRSPIRQELRPGSSWDPDASHAAAKLSAYFQLEEARASRRMLCRIVVVAAVMAALLEATTRIVSGGVFFAGVLALGIPAILAAIFEWRAEKQIQALTSTR